MSSIGDKLFRGARPDFGSGYAVPPEQVPGFKDAIYPAFESGLILSASMENVPQDCAIFALDMEVNPGGRLIRAPGLVLVEDASPRNLRYTFEQASLDYATELVTIDPPWMGYKSGGAYNWVNLGLAATHQPGWAATNVAGVLLFSNGFDKTYSRQPASAVVVDESAGVVARTLAVAFGRTFAGYYSIGGVAQSLGIKWNAASGAYNDWAGIGSGAELLLADVGEADKIVAMVTIGLDALGILCRKSIWVGYPTGDFLRPADPRIRVAGLGIAARDTLRLTPGGATFLSDDGVANFDLTNAAIISEAINSELLPLDYTRLSSYTATYQPRTQRYVLCTPYCTWIYEFPHPGGRKGRWFKRSIIADNALAWTEQSGGVYWDLMPGSWDLQVAQWNALSIVQSDAPALLHFILGSKLVREDFNSFTNLISPLTPYWRTPQNDKVAVTEQWSTMGFEVEYRSVGLSSIRLSATDSVGDPSPITVTKNLPVTGGKTRKYLIDCQSTGMGAQANIEILSGVPEIARIRQLLIPSGPTLISL